MNRLLKLTENTQQYGQLIEAHGKALEQMGGSSKGRLLTEEQGKFIEQAGQQMQEHGRTIQALAMLAQNHQQFTLQAHSLAVKEHLKVIKLQINVTQVLIKGI